MKTDAGSLTCPDRGKVFRHFKPESPLVHCTVNEHGLQLGSNRV